MINKIPTAWQRLTGLLTLEKRDVLQVFYYAVFAGLSICPFPWGFRLL